MKNENIKTAIMLRINVIEITRHKHVKTFSKYQNTRAFFGSDACTIEKNSIKTSLNNARIKCLLSVHRDT